jgi:hypothetical protein
MTSLFNRFYRGLFCSGGYGVHSPFAYDLITTVIEERRAYYCYEMLDRIRLQLQRENAIIRCGASDLTVKKVLQEYCFSTEGYRLLFRLTNYFRPEKTLVIGSGLGLTPLSVTAYARKTDCVVFEPEPSLAVIAHNMVKEYARSPIQIQDDFFAESGLPEMRNIDFIVWGSVSASTAADARSFGFFERLLRCVTDRSVLVIDGLRDSSAGRQVWKEVCNHPKVSVTFDLYSFGLVFFNSKLYRKTYRCVFM